jgi:hypothetical protein
MAVSSRWSCGIVISFSYFILLGKELKESEGHVVLRRGCGYELNHVNVFNV